VKKRKLLLDSCVAKDVAARLRADGHDVATVAERGADPGDPNILSIAAREGRALITIDHDFGALVFRDGAKHQGVLRLREAKAAALAERASQLVALNGDDLEAGSFVTDDGDRVRVTKR
jgi:predicted nuclease of predicted toxin-antitoxin system